MKKLFLAVALALTLPISMPVLADTVTGTAGLNPRQSWVSLVTPEGVSISGGVSNNGLPTLWIDPLTGAFQLYFDAAIGPNDYCNSLNWQVCSQAHVFGAVLGQLTLLPKGATNDMAIAPPQTVILHGSGSVEYWYRTEDLTAHHELVQPILMQFTLAITEPIHITQDGLILGNYSATAVYPDPTPEPRSLLLLVSGLGVLGFRSLNSNGV